MHALAVLFGGAAAWYERAAEGTDGPAARPAEDRPKGISLRFKALVGAASTAMIFLASVAGAPAARLNNPVAEFAGLDKITGRIINFDVYINETVQFGALQVTPRVCYSRPPTEPAQTDAFVEVDEVTLERQVKRIFTGWMFAASPGLHAVEHPVYDVWLTACKQSSAVAPPAQR